MIDSRQPSVPCGTMSSEPPRPCARIEAASWTSTSTASEFAEDGEPKPSIDVIGAGQSGKEAPDSSTTFIWSPLSAATLTYLPCSFARRYLTTSSPGSTTSSTKQSRGMVRVGPRRQPAVALRPRRRQTAHEVLLHRGGHLPRGRVRRPAHRAAARFDAGKRAVMVTLPESRVRAAQAAAPPVYFSTAFGMRPTGGTTPERRARQKNSEDRKKIIVTGCARARERLICPQHG